MENPLERGRNLSEIDVIPKTFGLQIINKEQIKDLVELPLVKACEVFWDKNIQTLESSVNTKDIGHEGYIGLDFNSLSDENKKVAKQYGEPHQLYVNNPDILCIRIPIPIHQGETVEEISNRAIQISNNFYRQHAGWISSVTLEEYLNTLEKNFGSKYPDMVKENKEKLTQPGAWEEELKRKGKYFDPETQTAWDSEELYKKSKDDLEVKD
jgi:hypothetical protein